jgi:hypothetical protein
VAGPVPASQRAAPDGPKSQYDCRANRAELANVAKWVASDVLPARRLMDPKSTNPVKFEGFLAQCWNEGFENGLRLLTEVRLQGYTGSKPADRPGRRRMPCRHGLLDEPDRQTSSPYQRGIVFRPVRHPVSDFRDLVAAAFVEFVRHGFHSQRASDDVVYRTVLPPTLLFVQVLERGTPNRMTRGNTPHATTCGLSMHQRGATPVQEIRRELRRAPQRCPPPP